MNHKRRQRMLKLLAEHRTATVQEIGEWICASPATVRRDIAWLAEHGLIVRTHGGAECLPSASAGSPLASVTFDHSLQCHAPHKRAIARTAAGMCADGETIIVNGGTTTFMMAEFLTGNRLKILTNSFLMAERLLETSENEIIVPGGKVYRAQNVILSPFDKDVTQHHYASRMFMSVYGLSPLGLMEADPLLIEAEKRLIGHADELVVLVDSSKFARQAGLILCPLERVATLVTDTDVADADVQLLERHGVRVVIADDAVPLPDNTI